MRITALQSDKDSAWYEILQHMYMITENLVCLLAIPAKDAVISSSRGRGEVSKTCH